MPVARSPLPTSSQHQHPKEILAIPGPPSSWLVEKGASRTEPWTVYTTSEIPCTLLLLLEGCYYVCLIYHFVPIVGRPLNLDGSPHGIHPQSHSSYHDSPRTRVAPHSLLILQCLSLFFILQLDMQHISIAQVSSTHGPGPLSRLSVSASGKG